ncbi:MAG: hypothetical protein COA86_14530 [Kangiella sp.]|nr:MAG: hypothetical protein COA86_14530 [Kangiella sp.]
MNMPTSIDRYKQEHSQDCLSNLPEFDFDEWASLHKNDPEAFEEKRIEWLTACIINAPQKYQKRLNGLMFHINSIRRLEKNPMQTCLKISAMMMDSLNDMRTFLSDLNSTISNNSEFVHAEKTSADILQFVRP